MFQATLDSTTYTLTDIEDQYKSIRENVRGIAVKLSTLNNVQISIRDIFHHWNRTIIIDAEYNRLDHWLSVSLDNNILCNSDLARMLVTVQIRREDAFEQLDFFKELGIGVILVAGHRSYINNQIKNMSVEDAMVEAIRKYDNIIYFGITPKLKKKIEYKLNRGLISSKILELLGSHQLINSSLWSYYVGDTLSMDATSYLARRKDNKQNKYFINSLEHLSKICKDNSIYLYVDILSKSDYLDKIQEIDNI